VTAPDRPDAGRTLLAVFAHPDDESIAAGGLLAWCADRGARVVLLCATRGGYSEDDPAGTAATTPPDAPMPPDARTRELAAAARELGLAEVVLLEYRDGYLPWEGGAALEADIRAAIARVRPDVVVTFGEDGLYWHPDHIAVHAGTTAAVAALGPEAPALFYVTTPPGQMRRVFDAAQAAYDARVSGGAGTGARPGPPRGILGIAAVDAFGAHAAAPTLIVDARAFAHRKLAALRCHRTQMAGDALDLLPDEDAPRLLGEEHYRRAPVGARGPTFIERLA